MVTEIWSGEGAGLMEMRRPEGSVVLVVPRGAEEDHGPAGLALNSTAREVSGMEASARVKERTRLPELSREVAGAAEGEPLRGRPPRIHSRPLAMPSRSGSASKAGLASGLTAVMLE